MYSSELVHIIGPMETSDVLIDPVFNISAPGALKLQRKVEVFCEDIMVDREEGKEQSRPVRRRWDASPNSTMPEITW